MSFELKHNYYNYYYNYVTFSNNKAAIEMNDCEAYSNTHMMGDLKPCSAYGVATFERSSVSKPPIPK